MNISKENKTLVGKNAPGGRSAAFEGIMDISYILTSPKSKNNWVFNLYLS